MPAVDAGGDERCLRWECDDATMLEPAAGKGKEWAQPSVGGNGSGGSRSSSSGAGWQQRAEDRD